MIYLCHLATEQIAQHSDVHLWGQVQGLLEGSLLCLMKNFYNDLHKTIFILKDLVYDVCRSPKVEIFESYPSGRIIHREYAQ